MHTIKLARCDGELIADLLDAWESGEDSDNGYWSELAEDIRKECGVDLGPYKSKQEQGELSRIWNRIGVIENNHTEDIAAKDGEIKFLKDLVLGMTKRMDALEQKMRSEGIVLRRHEAAINDLRLSRNAGGSDAP